MSHFSCIGLDGASPEVFQASVEQCLASAMPERDRLAWRDPSGAALTVHLVETSPALRVAQAGRLDATWHETIATLPDGPMIVIANEFFDALPIRQYRHDGTGWRETMVGTEGDRLVPMPAGGYSPLPTPGRAGPDGSSARAVEARARLAERQQSQHRGEVLGAGPAVGLGAHLREAGPHEVGAGRGAGRGLA